MARLFISYSRKDEAVARRIATALSDAGADVWIDVEDIPAGMNWSRAIQEGLDLSEAMIVIVSPDSMASKHVEDEWQFYLDEKKPVIPVQISPARRHFQINRLQYVDFERQPFERAFAQLHGELVRLGIRLAPLTKAAEAEASAGDAAAEAEASAGDAAAESGAAAETPSPAQPPSVPRYEALVTPSAPAPEPERKTAAAQRTFSPVLLLAGVAAMLMIGLLAISALNGRSAAATSETQTAALNNTIIARAEGSLMARTPTMLATIAEDISADLTREAATEEVTEAAAVEATEAATEEATGDAHVHDLVITTVERLNRPGEAGQIILAVRVYNEGTARAEGVALGWDMGGSLGHQTTDIGGIDPGVTVVVEVSDTFSSPGQFTATFVIDPANGVNEPSETNNSASFRFSVTADDLGQAEATAEATVETEATADVVAEPYGEQIAYASARDGDYDIYIYDLITLTDIQITYNDCDDTQPAWSPDGSELAYISDCDTDGNPEVFRLQLDRPSDERIPIQMSYGDATHSDPLWASDNRIYYISDESGETELWSTNLDGDDIRRHSDRVGIGRFGYDIIPNGTLRAAGIAVGDESDLDIYDPNFGETQRITFSPAIERDPDWSPDGQRIVYVQDAGDSYDVRMYIFTTGEDISVFSTGVENPAPDWSPGSNGAARLALIHDVDGTSGLYIYDVLQASFLLLVADETARDPAWRPEG